MIPMPVPIVSILPLNDTERIPQPLFRDGMFLIFYKMYYGVKNQRNFVKKDIKSECLEHLLQYLFTCNVRASSKSVWAFEPTAYINESSSTLRHTFSIVCGSR